MAQAATHAQAPQYPKVHRRARGPPRCEHADPTDREDDSVATVSDAPPRLFLVLRRQRRLRHDHVSKSCFIFSEL